MAQREPTEFGRRVTLAREARGLSRAQLAQLAGPIRVASVHEIEGGTIREPRHSRAVALARALAVPLEWLHGAGSPRVPKREVRSRTARTPGALGQTLADAKRRGAA